MVNIPSYDNTKTLLLIAGVAYVLYKVNQAKTAAEEAIDSAAQSVGEFVTEDINPGSNQNFIAVAVDDLTKRATGNENQTLGGWLYDVFN